MARGQDGRERLGLHYTGTQMSSAYRHFRANFTYDVIPIALFQAPIYVTSANEVLM